VVITTWPRSDWIRGIDGKYWQEPQAHALPSRSHPFLHQIRIQNRERQPRDHSHNHDIEPELIEIGQQEHKHEELREACSVTVIEDH
jgi:hypothetical protein